MSVKSSIRFASATGVRRGAATPGVESVQFGRGRLPARATAAEPEDKSAKDVAEGKC
jgi:hypothetical protein